MLLLSDGWKTLKYYDRKTGNIIEDPYIESRVDGKFRRSDTKHLININMKKSKDFDNYPVIEPLINGSRHIYRVHIAIITTFGDYNYKDVVGIPNLCVDHIDRNKRNFSLNNLRFVTPSQNNFNRGRKESKYYYIIYSTLTKIIINEIQKTKDIKFSLIKKKLKDTESICIFSENLYYHLNQLSIDNKIEYLESLDWRRIDNTFSISNVGILKVNYINMCTFTLGSLTNGYYRTTLTNRVKKPIHRLVAESFLNNGKEIDKNLVVDHINTNPLDNSVDNLRIVTQKQNINNKQTISKHLRPIKCTYNNTITLYFRGIIECAKIIHRRKNAVQSWVSGKYKCTIKELSNFQYVSPEECNLENIKFTESLEGLNLSLLSPKDVKTYEDMVDFINTRKLSSRKDFIKLGLESFYISFVHRFHPIKYYKDE